MKSQNDFEGKDTQKLLETLQKTVFSGIDFKSCGQAHSLMSFKLNSAISLKTLKKFHNLRTECFQQVGQKTSSPLHRVWCQEQV